MVENYSRSIISIFADFNDIPKVAVAERVHGRFTNQVVLPGIEGECRLQLEKIRDNIKQLTGVYISPPDRIRKRKDPIFLTEERSRGINFYYVDVPRSLSDRYMLCSQPGMLTQWKWETLSWLRKKTNNGLFPISIFNAVISASRSYENSWVGDIPADVYDFPHTGLH